MTKKILGLGEEVDSPSNFFNANTHIDKIEECKVYGKNGDLIKKISPKEQLKEKEKAMEGNPLRESRHPSGDNPLRESRHPSGDLKKNKKRKQGQQKKRANLFINFRSVPRTS